MDRWPIFQTLTFREFLFPVDRYEEYVDGKLISQGEVHFEIRFKQHNGGIFTKAGLITVNLQNNPIPEKILSKFEFDISQTMIDSCFTSMQSNPTLTMQDFRR